MPAILKLLMGGIGGSNNKAAVIVKTLRGVYVVQAGLIVGIWYAAYRNERVSPGEISFPIPLLSSDKRSNPPDRPEPELANEGEIAVVPGVTSLLPNGQKAESISTNDPPQLVKVVNWCNSVSGRYPYVWGGGHSQIGVPSGGGYDCSGAVSGAVGQIPGVLKVPLTSGQFAQVFPSGEGKYITIYGNVSSKNFPQGHVFMKVKSNGQWHWFGTGELGMDGGPAWGNNAIVDASEFQVSHPPGY